MVFLDYKGKEYEEETDQQGLEVHTSILADIERLRLQFYDHTRLGCAPNTYL